MEKYVLIGAGSAMFTRGPGGRHDPPGRALRAGAGGHRSRGAGGGRSGWRARWWRAAGAPVRLSAATDRREVLPGATVVICTIGVGGRRAWEQDVLIPRKYGIYQPVGD